MIRVGRRIYNKDGTFTDPSFTNFKDILCLTKSSVYGSLGPYCLTDENGQIMENIWQFSKIYESVPKSKQTYSRYDNTIIWDHPEETHAIKQNNSWTITPQYKLWREKGFKCKYPVRYPVGFHNRHKCIGAISNEEYNKCLKDEKYCPRLLNYIESRKEIYLKEYMRLVKKSPDFKKLLQMLKKGINLLIIEVDGPHQEYLNYYKQKYNVSNNFIENNTILVNKENMDIMLNDEKFPFGHGYCLGLALQEEINSLLG